jgi:hypothetical protein
MQVMILVTQDYVGSLKQTLLSLLFFAGGG